MILHGELTPFKGKERQLREALDGFNVGLEFDRGDGGLYLWSEHDNDDDFAISLSEAIAPAVKTGGIDFDYSYNSHSYFSDGGYAYYRDDIIERLLDRIPDDVLLKIGRSVYKW